MLNGLKDFVDRRWRLLLLIVWLAYCAWLIYARWNYITGFVLSVVLTAIPFWLVLGDVLNDMLKTSIVIMALAAGPRNARRPPSACRRHRSGRGDFTPRPHRFSLR